MGLESSFRPWEREFKYSLAGLILRYFPGPEPKKASSKAELPAEFKHINRRRKRNQKRFG